MMENPLNAYGKLDEAEQARLNARRKTKKRIAIIVLSSIVLVALVVAVVFGTKSTEKSKSNVSGSDSDSLSASLKAICGMTLYPDTCYATLEPVLKSSGNQKPSPEQIFKLSLQVAINELSEVSLHFSPNGSLFNGISDNMSLAALQSCNELLGLALDYLNSSLSYEDLTVSEALDDLKTWLSSTGTYQETCIDDLENTTGELSSIVSNYLKNSTELTSNSLAIVNAISNFGNSIKMRRLMSVEAHDGMPSWLNPSDRRLLETKSAKIVPDVVVSKDKYGNYKTINAALKAVPEKSKKRFVIYVKKGVYKENVEVGKSMWNVMVIGDGMDATIVTGSLNVVDGTPTFQSATFAVKGKGFIARDIGFRNTAGAAKHQAVALMSTSDESVFYRCRIDAFQDSLYAHSNRQFYRDCNIYGTVDFIFGNSAVVLQNCNILPRLPMNGQKNTITAQGRSDPNQNTGISIQNCTILNYGNLSKVQTYLGRPWKNYSTTVYLESFMGSLIDPKGWLPWVGDSAPSTIYYAEFQNRGPGSSTKNRVKWKGVRSNITSKEAKKFTVKTFIYGDKWLRKDMVPYASDLKEN